MLTWQLFPFNVLTLFCLSNPQEARPSSSTTFRKPSLIAYKSESLCPWQPQGPCHTPPRGHHALSVWRAAWPWAVDSWWLQLLVTPLPGAILGHHTPRRGHMRLKGLAGL